MTIILQLLMLSVYVTLSVLTAICAFRMVSDWLNLRNGSGL
jgi:hypothetical protein